MTVTYKGAQAVRTPEYSFRQDDGMHVNQRVRGIPSTVIGFANAYKDIGWDTYVQQDGPYSDLLATATTYRPDLNSPYIELWSIDTELVEKSLFTLPDAINEAGRFTPAEGGRAGYKKFIEDAVKNYETLSTTIFPIATWPWAHKIHEEMMRGVEVYEHEYTILTRTINFDFLYPPGNLVLKPTRYIYKTHEIESLEHPPASVLFKLPAYNEANNPNQAMWGWRIRDQHAEITNATTGQHVTSWVYAAWSTFLYTPYSTS